MREWRDVRLYFRALADVRRLRMVAEMARVPEISVKELCVHVRASQPLVSWHLRVLVKCGLVKTRRQGRQVFCSINRPAFAAYQARLAAMIDERQLPADLSRSPGLRASGEEDVPAREEAARLVPQPPPLSAGM